MPNTRYSTVNTGELVQALRSNDKETRMGAREELNIRVAKYKHDVCERRRERARKLFVVQPKIRRATASDIPELQEAHQAPRPPVDFSAVPFHQTTMADAEDTLHATVGAPTRHTLLPNSQAVEINGMITQCMEKMTAEITSTMATLAAEIKAVADRFDALHRLNLELQGQQQHINKKIVDIVAHIESYESYASDSETLDEED